MDIHMYIEVEHIDLVIVLVEQLHVNIRWSIKFHFPSVDDTELLIWPQQSRLRGTIRIPRKVWIGNN